MDGGGTKTAFSLIDTSGRLVARALGAGAYYFSGDSTDGVRHVERVLTEGITSLCADAGIQPADIGHAFFGLPGYGESSGDVAALDAAPHSALGHHRYSCDNDMVCGWAGSLGAADGINVISGTGSMTYGEREGLGVRTGGWGELFGDEGSAYWIAVRGLNVFSRMSDGRLPEGPLAGVLRRGLKTGPDLDLIDTVFNRWRGRRSDIAALSPLITEAAGLGDSHAAAILSDAGYELALLADSARRRLGFTPGETVPVSYSGGVFSSAPVLKAFAAGLRAYDAAYELRQPLFEPVIGAAIHAARLAGSPLGAASLEGLTIAATRTAPGAHDTP
ncbi:N-acetylglucosamine kinase [Streptomyces sp. NBC_00859]|uniref:N-acetylglucosamine kinase n=1 Tax=Streptomyces sp. NBC_00859 TaxID=2903682 RepID=UPI003870A39F|nr:N-acetylglucosamine kinase [Streptomyces sp. NBC_00859]